MTLDLFDNNGAVVSKCGLYRYELWRIWNDSKPKVLFIMFNPSSADANRNDATLRRCMKFARSWGYGGVYIGNLIPYRATKPAELKAIDQETLQGDGNISHIETMALKSDKIVFAWGDLPNKYFVEDVVVRLKYPLAFCLDKTNSGNPRHPLYVKGSIKPISFNADYYAVQ
jgi:hypothetical protein